MDPLTQGTLGALAAQSASSKADLGKAALIGGLAAMTPDLDVLIRSSTDPVLALEYHRHFTHSLFYIPLGGLLAGLLLHGTLGRRWGLSMKLTLAFSMLGIATHGLLDLCTSYGTSLLWPVSDLRLSLDLVSIIDPLVTLPLLLAVALARWRRSPRLAWVGLLWLFAYLFLGGLQQQRAESEMRAIAEARGHEPNHLRAMPSLGNLLVWRTVYESGGAFHVDAVGVGLGAGQHFPGASAEVADLRRSWEILPEGSQQLIDAQRFARFSQGYINFVPGSGRLKIGDIRYAPIPDELEPLWGITLAPVPDPTAHVEVFMPYERDIGSLARLWAMVKQTANAE
ncbi:MAG: metal-dependent hydrolase [Pseudomonadota bacterium]